MTRGIPRRLLVGAALVASLGPALGACGPSAPVPTGGADADGALGTDAAVAAPGWSWSLPRGFPPPPVPADNPMSRDKVDLGRHLFYDSRLSRNGTQSCASCHRQELAFTDGRVTAVGSTGQIHPRNAMSVVNTAYAVTLTWANPLMTALERQAEVPLFGDAPIELGQVAAADVEAALGADARYQKKFAAAFPDTPAPVTLEHALQALSAFERTILSGDSPYDRWIQGVDANALSASAQRGYALFNSERLRCSHCHVGFNLTDHTTFEGKAFTDRPYHNTGLYNIDGKGAYPEPNTGVYHVTGVPTDMGRFKAPTLRNIALTAPYMHDGSIATLWGVLDHYAAGGRTILGGPNAGVGRDSPLKESILSGFTLSDQERQDVIEFLGSLTDSGLIANPAYSDPW